MSQQSVLADSFNANSAGVFIDRAGYVLTGNIILSYLQPDAVLLAPEQTTKRFKWHVALFEPSDLEAIDKEDPSILYITSDHLAPQALEQCPTAYFLVITRDSAIPNWAARNKTRVILVKSPERFFYVVSSIQNLFTSMLVWECELDRIVSGHESLNSLLGTGHDFIGNFMCLTDSGFNLIASFDGVEPPDATFATLLETGCYPPSEIHHMETELYTNAEPGQFLLDDSHTTHDCDVLHLPIYSSGKRFFQLSMCCPDEDSHAATIDLFAIFSERATRLCASFFEEIIECESPWHRVLTNYIEEIPMKGSYVQTQLELTDIHKATHFKLLCLEVSSEHSPTTRSQVVEAAEKLNDGRCYPFAYNNSLLVLCYQSTGDESRFSVGKLKDDLRKRIVNRFGVRVGISKTFTLVPGIRVAYMQARLALNFSSVIDREFKLTEKTPDGFIYTFNEAYPYYVTAKMMRDDPVVYSSIHYSFVHKLADEDHDLGTQSVKLLWTYLSFERNATAVSKALHMHRNTVLYHIGKIEQRFSVDLDSLVDRYELLVAIRAYLLSDGFAHEIEYEDLLTIHKSSMRTFSSMVQPTQ